MPNSDRCVFVCVGENVSYFCKFVLRMYIGVVSMFSGMLELDYKCITYAQVCHGDSLVKLSN